MQMKLIIIVIIIYEIADNVDLSYGCVAVYTQHAHQ